MTLMTEPEWLKDIRDVLQALLRIDGAFRCENDPLWVATSRMLALIDTQAKAIAIAREALDKLDTWQGKQGCEASVYHLDEDEFGTCQYLIHRALAEIDKLLGEK